MHAQWSAVHSGAEGSSTKDLFFLDNDYGYVIGYFDEGSYILRTHDGGVNWDSLRYDDHYFESIFMTSNDTGYVSSFYEGQMAVLRTIDAGDSWQMVASELYFANAIPYAISFFDNDTGIISVQGFGAITTNAGVDWEEIDPDQYQGFRDNDVGVDEFVSFEGALITWSIDRCVTFHADTLEYQGSHNSLDVLDHRFISSAIGTDGQVFDFPYYSFGIVTIGDVETEEFNISYFPDLNRVLGVSRPLPNVLYAICRYYYSDPNDPKLFMKSVDGGQSWFFQDVEGPEYFETRELFCVNDTVCYAYKGFGSKIYKTTNGGGPLGDLVTQIPLSLEDISKPQIAFELFPNPSTGVITIQCDEPIDRVEVLDISGRLLYSNVAIPANGELDVYALPSGVYLVKVEVIDGGHGVRKLVVE